MFCTFQNLLLLFFAKHVLYTAQGALLKALSRIIPWNEVEESVEKRPLGNQQSFQYSYGGCHSTAAHPSSSRSFPRHRLTALTPLREVFSDCIAPRAGELPALSRSPAHPNASRSTVPRTVGVLENTWHAMACLQCAGVRLLGFDSYDLCCRPPFIQNVP